HVAFVRRPLPSVGRRVVDEAGHAVESSDVWGPGPPGEFFCGGGSSRAQPGVLRGLPSDLGGICGGDGGGLCVLRSKKHVSATWPFVNACLNAGSALCLAAGYAFIRRKETGRHRI